MNDQRQPRLVVVDDDVAIMQCVGCCLEQQHRIQVVGYASHAQAGLALALELRPDAVLMDIHMPGADAFEVCRKLVSQTEGRTRVLFFTGFPTDHYLDRCLDVGGSGVISKHTEGLAEVALAVRHVLRGERYFSPELAHRMTRLESGAVRSPLSTLAQREVEVLRLLADGKTNRQISRQLDISLRSVEKEIADLKRKIGVASTAELLMYGAREGLVFPELCDPCRHQACRETQPSDNNRIPPAALTPPS